MHNAITMVVLFGLLQGLMVTYVFSLKGRFSGHSYLVFFLLVLLFVQVHSFLVRSGLMAHTLFLFNSNTPFIFLFGPLVYFYTRRLIRPGIKISAVEQLVHALPFLSYLGYSFNFFLQDTNYKLHVLSQMVQLPIGPVQYNQLFPADPWNVQGWVVVEVLCLSLVAYSIYCLYLLARNAGGQTRTQLSQSKWAIFLNSIMLIGGLVLFLSEGGIINGRVFFQSPFPDISGDLFSTVAMYATTFYLLGKPQFLAARGDKYQKSSLSKDYKVDKLRLIKNAFEQQQLYLQPDFSLQTLASKTRLSKHHISQIINEEMGITFFELTNQYRIEEAKRLLQQSDFVKMEALAYQLGYKSKSSFFNAFKKATTLTPAKYLQSATL